MTELTMSTIMYTQFHIACFLHNLRNFNESVLPGDRLWVVQSLCRVQWRADL